MSDTTASVARAPRIVRQPGSAGGGLDVDGIPDILRRVYSQRGVTDPAELDRKLGGLVPYRDMAGLQEAVELLAGALEVGARILVIGDFDADGATSSALAVLALRAFGHREVDYLVPNRFEYGYGLTPEIVDEAASRWPDVIITVDNGVASIDGVARANAMGTLVVVTDHHLQGERLPEAAAIVNPNLRDNPFPSKALAGVGVIFYVMLGLRARLRALDWFERHEMQVPNMAEYLDLVALGTVADVVPLDRNNRILVHHGLERMRAGRCRPGITALLEVAGRSPARAQATDIGFGIGPRLNAAGRLDDMRHGIECLLTDDPQRAREYASQLDQLNRDRRRIEGDMREQAEAMLQEVLPEDGDDELPWSLCLYREQWHQGVIGILASRIKERYNRPVIAFAAGDDGNLKGSARSIKGLHIRDALDLVDKRNPGLILRFGGHAMAAGLALPPGSLDTFSAALDSVVHELLSEADLLAEIHSDGGVEPREMRLETAQVLLDGGPWGQGFPEPLFDDVFRVLSSRIVGEKHWKLVLAPPGGEPRVDAIAFNAVERFPRLPDVIHAAYRLDVNEWQGRVNLQLRVEHMTLPEAH